MNKWKMKVWKFPLEISSKASSVSNCPSLSSSCREKTLLNHWTVLRHRLILQLRFTPIKSWILPFNVVVLVSTVGRDHPIVPYSHHMVLHLSPALPSFLLSDQCYFQKIQISHLCYNTSIAIAINFAFTLLLYHVKNGNLALITQEKGGLEKRPARRRGEQQRDWGKEKFGRKLAPM